MNPLAFALLAAFQQAAPLIDVPKSLLKPVPAVNQVLAKVDGQEIKSSDVEALLWEWRKADVVNDLVTYQIVRAAATKAGVSATDDEVLKEVSALLNGIKQTLPVGQTIEQAMEAEGTAPSRLFVRVKTEILLRKYILVGFKQADFVKISTIVIKPASASTADVKVALEKADKTYGRLTGGEKWDAVLLSVTDDERARASLGLVGWRPTSLFPESVQQELGTLKQGSIAKPAQTQNGIQIFRIEALGKAATAEELLELQESYVGGQRQQAMAKLRAASKVEKF
jgi:parvulin-like peptidyl-prolyl isomerase